jgi:D-alanyl-D-alanine carboxypeptidase
MDGIKTGYTRSSGFNLLTSVKRDGHFIIAVVLGGASSSSRDRIMDDLIEAHIDDGSAHRGATAVADKESDDDNSEVSARLEHHEKSAPMFNAADIAAGAIPMPIERPRPAFISAAPAPMPLDDSDEDSDAAWARSKHAVFDGTTARSTISTATPSTLHWIGGPAPARERDADKTIIAPAAPDSTGSVTNGDEVADLPSGWMIQIGAPNDAGKANDLLERAKAEGHGTLNHAKPFTEKVQKGTETLYRARFAGLDADAAEAACKSLKHAGFACFTIRN